MPDYPQLTYISVDMLISAAGGDPWMVDETVRSGDPGQIAELARVFHEAGACTTETYREFTQAQTRFRASWNHEDGGYPINDSAEVHRASTNLLVQSEELPAIGADLQVIAADLAEAQRFSDLHIDNLNTQLHHLDACIGQALAADEDSSELEESAVSVARSTLGSVEAIRDDYGAKLERSLTELRHDHGYDPAVIEDVDGDAEAGPLQRGRTAAEYYDLNQRAKDEALVDSTGPISSEKSAAAARLRDFGRSLTLRATQSRVGSRENDSTISGWLASAVLFPGIPFWAATRAPEHKPDFTGRGSSSGDFSAIR